MDQLIAQIVKKHYPEISQGYHVPVWARVVSIDESCAAGDISTQYRARYAVNVQILTRQGDDVPGMIINNVAISGTLADGAGIMHYPSIGATVELRFAFGDITKPYIAGVLPYELTTPSVAPGEVVIQSSANNKLHLTQSGDMQQLCTGKLTQIAANISIAANKLNSSATAINTAASSHIITTALGKIEQQAGALHLLSTGHAELSALDAIHLTSASDINVNAAQKIQQRAAESIDAKVDKSSLSISKSDIKLESDQVSLTGKQIKIGSDAVNLLDIIAQMSDLINQIATQLAAHAHTTTAPGSPTSPPLDAPLYAGHASQAATITQQIKSIS